MVGTSLRCAHYFFLFIFFIYMYRTSAKYIQISVKPLFPNIKFFRKLENRVYNEYMENNGFALKVFQQEVCQHCDCQTVLDPNPNWHQDELFANPNQ